MFNKGLCISIHAPRRGSDRTLISFRISRKISIHAPRRGSDDAEDENRGKSRHFNPRSPQGERLASSTSAKHGFTFQSTLPAGGATYRHAHLVHRASISIHAPRRGSDGLLLLLPLVKFYFNPRSPQGERHSVHVRDVQLFLFQSTLPAGGATVQSKHTAMTA